MTTPAVSAKVLARKRLRVWTILLTSGLAFLAPSAIAPGLPALRADYAHVENAAFLSPLVLTMPMLFIALAGPFVGYAVDRFGGRFRSGDRIDRFAACQPRVPGGFPRGDHDQRDGPGR
jgi:MFS family permease